MSNIEWTQETWNPVVGCTPVSAGCRNCYAARDALRMAGNPHPKIGPVYEGLATKAGDGRPVFTGKVRRLVGRLGQPFWWKKPRMVFVNSMSDLFHPDVPFWMVDQVYDVMCRASRHTFQVLTKRPERMSVFFGAREPGGALIRPPLPNVWLGTSIEDQATADERIPHLLQTPAAVRFVSYEPALGPVDLQQIPDKDGLGLLFPLVGEGISDGMNEPRALKSGGIHWVIAGGESGPRARPCNVQWLRDVVRQCKDAGVPCFVKQLGTRPESWCVGRLGAPEEDYDDDFCDLYEASEIGDPCTGRCYYLRSPKGSDPEEWPEDLRVREWPERTDP